MIGVWAGGGFFVFAGAAAIVHHGAEIGRFFGSEKRRKMGRGNFKSWMQGRGERDLRDLLLLLLLNLLLLGFFPGRVEV